MQKISIWFCLISPSKYKQNHLYYFIEKSEKVFSFIYLVVNGDFSSTTLLNGEREKKILRP